MNRLAGEEPEVDDKQYYRELLEKIANDHSALDAATSAVNLMDDPDCQQEVIANAVALYEQTKGSIANKILAKLG